MTDATEQERREAEALRRLLEDGGDASAADGAATGAAPGAVPDGALEAAALLNWATDRDSRPAGRHAALRAELLATADRAPAQGWGRWLLPAGAFGAAVAAVVLSLTAGPGAKQAPLPEPDHALLVAQARAIESRALDLHAEELAALDDAMRSYRATVLTTLAERYGEAE